MRKVVITGFGVVSSSGNDAETLWKNISSGKSGIRYIDDPLFDGSPVRIAGKVDDFCAEEYLGAKDAKKYDKYILFAVAAAMQAMNMSGLELAELDTERAGVYVGSGVGGIETVMRNYEAFLAKGARRVSPFMIPTMISNMASGVVAIKTGFKGQTLRPCPHAPRPTTPLAKLF